MLYEESKASIDSELMIRLMLANIIIYGVIDSILTLLIINSLLIEFNPIANFNFYVFVLVKIGVLGGIYLLMVQSQRNFPGYILLFIGSVASIHNIGVLFFD